MGQWKRGKGGHERYYEVFYMQGVDLCIQCYQVFHTDANLLARKERIKTNEKEDKMVLSGVEVKLRS